MDTKIIFLDVDGTPVTDNQEIPDSAIKACQAARGNGHKIYLCTGRSKPEIYQEIIDIGFDGIIGAGGGFVESVGELLYHKQVKSEDIRSVLDYFQKHRFDFYLESNVGLFASEHLKERLTKLFYGEIGNDAKLRAEAASHPFIEVLIDGEQNLVRPDVNKICFIEHPRISYLEVRKEFEGLFEVIQCTVPAFGSNSGELMVPGVNKAVAIEHLLTHLNLSQADTFAVGDGLNDISMFEYCKIGIAMGNAQPGLKSRADYITKDVEHDGIYHAFKKYDLI